MNGKIINLRESICSHQRPELRNVCNRLFITFSFAKRYTLQIVGTKFYGMKLASDFQPSFFLAMRALSFYSTSIKETYGQGGVLLLVIEN